MQGLLLSSASHVVIPRDVLQHLSGETPLKSPAVGPHQPSPSPRDPLSQGPQVLPFTFWMGNEPRPSLRTVKKKEEE